THQTVPLRNQPVALRGFAGGGGMRGPPGPLPTPLTDPQPTSSVGPNFVVGNTPTTRTPRLRDRAPLLSKIPSLNRLMNSSEDLRQIGGKRVLPQLDAFASPRRVQGGGGTPDIQEQIAETRMLTDAENLGHVNKVFGSTLLSQEA